MQAIAEVEHSATAPGRSRAAALSEPAALAVLQLGLLARRLPGAPPLARWMAPALLFAGLAVWRDSPVLKALDALGIGAVLAVAALRARGRVPGRAGLAELLGGVLAAGADALGGGGRIRAAVPWRKFAGSRAAKPTIAVLRGTVVALPLLVLFGALLTAADADFARLISRVFRPDFPRIASHLGFAAFAAWVAAGSTNGLLGAGIPLPGGAARRPGWLAPAVLEVGVVLLLLDALFLAFVAVQLPYLFGGAPVVETTGGWGYATYARRGFFELVTVAALVLPVLLGAEWLLRGRSAVDLRPVRILAAVQVGLLGVIMASALQRM